MRNKRSRKFIIIMMVLILSSIIYQYLRQPEKAAPARSPQCYGLYLGQKISAEDIESASSDYGKRPCVILYFAGWGDAPFEKLGDELRQITSSGAVPMITLEPWYYPSKAPVSLNSIASGKEDATLLNFARMLNGIKGPVYVRFAHEMNGNWYPWSGIMNGNDPHRYIDAYQRVNKVVRKAAPNADLRWVWSINADSVPNRKWNRAEAYYPGGEYVDVIGIDGYNWNKKWLFFFGNRSFDSIFRKQVKTMRKNHPGKPIYITEMAASGSPSQKARWISSFMEAFTGDYGDIQLFIWFDINKERDWRIKSDMQSLDAFKSGLKKIDNGGIL